MDGAIAPQPSLRQPSPGTTNPYRFVFLFSERFKLKMLHDSPSAYVGGLFCFSERFTFFKVETLWFSAFAAARQGYPFRPLPLMQRVAGAKAIPDARRADGAPQQARSSPRPQAGEGSRRCPMRHAAGGVQSNKRDKFRVPAQRGVRGCRGCRGAAAPLTPCPAPGRRPAARAGQQPQCTERHRLTTTRAFQT